MSDLINRIPGNESAMASLATISRNTNQTKARQRITGRAGQLGYAIQSVNAWDLTETFPTTSGVAFSNASYRVTYTSDGTQRFPIVIPATDIRINGTGDANKPSIIPNSGLYSYADGSGEVQIQTFEMPDQAYFASETQLAWSFDLLYRGSVTIRFKARGNATSNGTFSIVRTA